MNISQFPQLIEPTAKYFLTSTLKKCHEHRVYLYYLAFNTIIFIIFFLITSSILYYCHKNKLTPEEKYHKMIRDQEYVLSKIRFFKENIQTDKTSLITNLPKM
jgi:hypothetical protein